MKVFRCTSPPDSMCFAGGECVLLILPVCVFGRGLQDLLLHPIPRIQPYGKVAKNLGQIFLLLSDYLETLQGRFIVPKSNILEW